MHSRVILAAVIREIQAKAIQVRVIQAKAIQVRVIQAKGIQARVIRAKGIQARVIRAKDTHNIFGWVPRRKAQLGAGFLRGFFCLCKVAHLPAPAPELLAFKNAAAL